MATSDVCVILAYISHHVTVLLQLHTMVLGALHVLGINYRKNYTKTTL